MQPEDPTALTPTGIGPMRASLFLLRLAPQGRLLLVIALMIGVAVTEGLGIILLVPMLALLDTGGTGDASGMTIAHWIGDMGLPLDLRNLLALFVVLVALRALMLAARAIAGLRLEIALVDGLRDRLYRAILAAQWRMTGGMRQTDNVSMMISRVDTAGYCFNRTLGLAATLVTLGGIAATAFYLSPKLAGIAIVGGLLVLAGFSRFRQRSQELGVALGDAYDAIHSQLQQGLAALRLIKMLGRERRSAADARAVFAQLRQAQLDYVRSLHFGQVLLQSGAALALAVIVWLAIARWHTDANRLLPLIALSARAVPLLSEVVSAWQDWLHSAPSAMEVEGQLRQLERFAEPVVPEGAIPPALEHSIALEDVTLAHDDRSLAALLGASILFPARKITAIMGHSGSGKSTVADLVSGLIAPDSGTVTLDRVALDDDARCLWRKAVAYVQQEPVLFNGSIRENLLWAEPEADETAMIAALRDASALFVLDLPKGLDTLVGDSGRQLSGGERQRIVLARALLRHPALLILDEATSALDAANEAAIGEAISRLRGRMTIIIIGHRGALSGMADRLVTLDGGRVVACIDQAIDP